jgi:hypothetical protein
LKVFSLAASFRRGRKDEPPATITAGVVTGFFGDVSLATGAGAAAANSFARGNTAALRNFNWSQLANLAAKAAASKIPGLKPWAETIGDVAGEGVDLATKAKEACQ